MAPPDSDPIDRAELTLLLTLVLHPVDEVTRSGARRRRDRRLAGRAAG